MFVIKLPNGNLMVPESATDTSGGVTGDAYVEIGPADPDYRRLSGEALSLEELARRRQGWRDGDAALRQQFEQYRAGREAGGKPGSSGEGRQPG
jgi:hypothetical protein